MYILNIIMQYILIDCKELILSLQLNIDHVRYINSIGLDYKCILEIHIVEYFRHY